MGAYPSSRVQIHPPRVGSPNLQCVRVKLPSESLESEEQSSPSAPSYLVSSTSVSPSTSQCSATPSTVTKQSQDEHRASTDLAISFLSPDSSKLSPPPDERSNCSATRPSPNLTTMIGTVAYSQIASNFIPQDEIQSATNERSKFVDIPNEVAMLYPWTVNELKRMLHLYLSLKRCNAALSPFGYSLISTNDTSHPYRQYIVCHGEHILMSEEVYLSNNNIDDVSLSLHHEGLSLSESDCRPKRPVWFIIDSLMIHLSSCTLDSLKQYAPFARVIGNCYKALPSDANNLLSSDFCPTADQTESGIDLRIVSSTAVSIALCESLREVGITPDSIVAGNIVGYLLLCYLDGVLTMEQCMQVAYFIAKATSRVDIPEGAVAGIVGLTSTEFATVCPDNVYVTCVYGTNSVFITGEKETITSLVKKLEQEGVAHVELLSSSCLPLQTPIMQPAFDKDVLSALRSIIGLPQPLSTQCLVALETDSQKLECSVELLMCSLTQPTNFSRAFEKFPHNGIILELGSNSYLNHALHVHALSTDNPDLTVIPVLSHNGLDQCIPLMQAIGECRNAGLDVRPMRLLTLDRGELSQTLAPPTVSENVYSIHASAHKVTLNTSPLHKYPSSLLCTTTHLNSVIGERMKISEYILNRVATVPVAYPLMLVWKTLADNESKSLMDLSVTFEDVTIHSMIELDVVSKDKCVSLCILISSLSGHFEISVNDKVLVASGKIFTSQPHSTNRSIPVQSSTNYRYNGECVHNKENDSTATTDATSECLDCKIALKHNASQTTPKGVNTTTVMVLNQQDLYKELSLKGYQIGDCFHVLSKASDLLLNECELSLTFTTDIEMLVALIDSALQIGVLQHTSTSCNNVLYPSAIRSLQITPDMISSAHKACASPTIYYSTPTDTYYTDGYSLTGLKFIFHPRRQSQDVQPRIERYKFQPYFQYILDKHDSSSSELKTLMDIVSENTSTQTLSVLHVVNAEGGNANISEQEICTQVKEFARACSVIQDIVTRSELLGKKEHTNLLVTATGDAKLYDLIVVSDVSANSDVRASLSDKQSFLLNKLNPGGFVLIREPLSFYDSRADSPQKSISRDTQKSNLHCVARRHFNNTETATDSESVLLLYHHVPNDVISNSDFAIVKVSMKDKNLPWITQLKKLLKAKVSPKRIYCVSEFEPECPSGVIGMINCMRLESYSDRVRCVYLRDSKLEESEFYSSTIWHQIRTTDVLMNVIKNGQLGSYRLVTLEANKVCLSPSLDCPITIKTESEDILSPTNKVNYDIDGQERTHEEFPADTKAYSCGSQYPNIGHPASGSLESRQLDSTSSLFHCDPHKSYIITGGLGGVGLELALWLAEHGAKKLILTSRSGIKTAYQARKLKMLQASNVDVIVSNLDVSQESQAHELVDMAVNNFNMDSIASREIGGILHLAVVIRDCKFESQTVKRFQTVMGPKSTGALNLDKALCHLSTLGYNVRQTLFVVFSSACSGLGHATQSSYGFANSSMERLCEDRQEQGLHGLAIQWGAIGDVGVLHNMMRGQDVKSIGGTRSQPLHSCLASLETILNLPLPAPPVVSCYVPALNEAVKNEGDGPVGAENDSARTFVKEIVKEHVPYPSTSTMESNSVISGSVDAGVVVSNGIPVISSETSVSTVSTCDSQSDLVNVQERSDE